MMVETHDLVARKAVRFRIATIGDAFGTADLFDARGIRAAYILAWRDIVNPHFGPVRFAGLLGRASSA